jgi:Domain of unknown function (DUF222)/HNH endonuclease
MSRAGKAFDESRYEASRAPELITKLDTKMSQIRLLHAELLDVVADMDREQILNVTGYSKLAHLVAEVLHVTPKQARDLVAEAAQITETLTPTGHTTPAALPNVRAALHAGLLDGDHVRAIAETVKEIPDTAPLGAQERVEATLAQAARSMDALAVREQGKHLLNHLDPDGKPPADEDPTELRNTFAYRMGRDGRMRFTGDLEPETAAVFERMVLRESKPQPPAKDVPDPRSARERFGDAVADIIHRAANPKGGAKAQLTVFLDFQALTDAVAGATLDTGCPLSPEAVRRLACDADFIPMVLNSESVPLDAGRSRRLVKPKQREALVARDRGCAYPGCCVPAAWTDAHHIIHWLDGGLTNLDNLVLLCRKHHMLIHHSPWVVRIHDGRPEFIPPKWVDPLQRRLRNTIRH